MSRVSKPYRTKRPPVHYASGPITACGKKRNGKLASLWYRNVSPIAAEATCKSCRKVWIVRRLLEAGM